MKIALWSKSDLSIFNKRSLKYNLADAEKDYFLAIVSKIIYESSLRDKLVFKGGTAIHHTYLPQARFSEDLDFTSLDKSITSEEVEKVLGAYDFMEIKNKYMSEATIKIERLKYIGPLGFSNSIKVEIDYMQNVILPAQLRPYKNAWKVDVNVNVMDIREICAEKIRAASGRARYRDFYDLVLLFNLIQFDIKEIIELVKRKEIRKPITQKSMLENWKIAKQERQGELSGIYYAEDVNDKEVETLIQKIEINVR
ncbi:MAG: nucleotidyl transferase AbiEii/AbiGii toxin family protein [Candidatus Omnitrophota bacterium]